MSDEIKKGTVPFSDQIDLTPAERDLEMALRSLRPAPARLNPVAAALAAGRRSSRPQHWRLAAAAAAAVLVASAAWLAMRPDSERPDFVAVPTPFAQPDNFPAPGPSVDPPTLLAYRQALARSPAALDELLDRQAVVSGPHGQLRAVGVVSLWNTDLNSPLGEM